MRPVDLLPEQHRPRAATGSQAGSAYVVVGLLAAALIAVLVYAITANRVNSLKEETIRVEAEASSAEARAAVLAPFAQFQQVKETRVQSVSGLAQNRVDWERLSRELAHVLPAGAWLSAVEASTTAEGSEVSTADGEGNAHTGPSVTLIGCAESQPLVARMLVRLRRLDRAEEVELIESVKGQEQGGGTGGTTTSGSGASEGSGGGCDDLYAFNAKVNLAPIDPVDTLEDGLGRSVEVPASLGGGS